MTGFKKVNNSDPGTSSKHGGDDFDDIAEILNGGTVLGKTAQIGKQIIPLSVTIGDYSQPTSAESPDDNEATFNNGYNTLSSNFVLGNIHFVKFSGLDVGVTIKRVALDWVASAGNIRIGVYDEVGGVPLNLLDELGSTSIGGTGIQEYVMPTGGVVPANGILWIGVEHDNSGHSWRYNSGEPAGTYRTISHTYGTFPDPVGSTTSGTSPFWCRITVLDANGSPDAVDNNPSTHFESNSVVTPEIIIDHDGTLQELVSIVVNKHANDTVSLAKLQLSPNKSTWTDFRLLDWANDFTTGVDTFILINRPLEKMIYFRIIGDDAGPKVLAIAEIKTRSVTESVANRIHEHKTISITDTTLKPNGDP